MSYKSTIAIPASFLLSLEKDNVHQPASIFQMRRHGEPHKATHDIMSDALAHDG